MVDLGLEGWLGMFCAVAAGLGLILAVRAENLLHRIIAKIEQRKAS
jgi:hypothetical protein